MNDHRYKVLLVEDDVIDQEAFTRFVKKENLPYDYSMAGSTQESREILVKEYFDIILIDFKLGDGNAFDLTDLLGDIPVIFITGKGDEKIAVEAMKLGASDYLIKDLDRNYLTVLPTVIDKAIKLKRAEKENRLLSELHNTVFENSFDGIAVMDLEGNIIYSNNTLAQITGYPESELSDLNLSAITSGSQLVSYILLSCKQHQRISNLQATLIPKKGSIVPVALSARLIKNQEKIIFSIHDLRTESELGEELTLFRKFSVDHIHVTFYRVGSIGPEVIVSEPLSFVQEDQDELLIRTGVYYSASLGQGHTANTGLFGPLPIPDLPGHVGIVYSFFKVDPSNRDPRMEGKSYSFFIFFMPENLSPLFNNRSSITDIIEKKLRTVSTIKEINLWFLIALKYKLLGLIQEEPVFIQILSKNGLSLFFKSFISETRLTEERIEKIIKTINSFSKKIFFEPDSIENIKFGEYTILLQPSESLIFCYTYKYESYNAPQKLIEFIEKIRKSQNIWNSFIEKSELTSSFTEIMEKISNDIFLSYY